MKRGKILGILASTAMVLSLITVPAGIKAANADAPFVDGSNQPFDTLNDAMEKGDGTIILQKDATQAGVTIAENKDIKLDLNGKKLTLTTGNPALSVKGTLEITGNGALTRKGYGYLIKNQGSLSIDNGTYSDDTEDQKEQDGVHNSALIANVGTMEIHGGTFTDTGIVIKNDDSSASVYGHLTIHNGVFQGIGHNPSWPTIQNSGVMTVNQGVYRGNASVIRSYRCTAPTKTTLVNGTFTTNGTYVVTNFYDEYGSGQSLVNEIRGGSYNGRFGSTYIEPTTPAYKGDITTTITGGTFSDKTGVKVSDGYTLYEANGKYHVGLAATGIVLDKTKADLKVGVSTTLKATITPAQAVENVTWSSSDPTVASVKDGVVTALAQGKATITAKAGKVQATCSVNVTTLPVADIPSFDPSKPVDKVQIGIHDLQSIENLSSATSDIVVKVLKGNDVSSFMNAETQKAVEKALQEGTLISSKLAANTVKEADVNPATLQEIKSFVRNDAKQNKKVATIVQYLDLNVMLTAEGTTLGNLQQLTKPITFTLAVPQDLVKTDCSFYIVRVHNGVADKLKTTKNSDGTLSFTTDRFSAYALVYEEAKSTTVPGDSDTTKPVKKPSGGVQTGDTTNQNLLFAMMIGGLVMMGTITVLNKKKNLTQK